jgi:hypothetical protein
LLHTVFLTGIEFSCLQVFVEDVSQQLPSVTAESGEITEIEFDRLASVAAAARGSVNEIKPFSIPAWYILLKLFLLESWQN